MPLDRRDAARLWDMLVYAREAAFFVRGRTWEEYQRDRMLRAAVERVVLVIGEAASKVSMACRTNNPEVPWQAISAQRHILVHEYARIDHEKIWRVATEHVPVLIGQLEVLLPPPPPNPVPEPDDDQT